jgi:hypothetical protein
MADAATKPDLKATHARLRAQTQYFLEILARAQASGSPSVLIQLPAVASIAKDLTTSMMDLEGYFK